PLPTTRPASCRTNAPARRRRRRARRPRCAPGRRAPPRGRRCSALVKGRHSNGTHSGIPPGLLKDFLMRVLLTGSSGWLGRFLAPRLHAPGDVAIGLDIAPGADTHVVGSVAERAVVERAFSSHSI